LRHVNSVYIFHISFSKVYGSRTVLALHVKNVISHFVTSNRLWVFSCEAK